VVANLNWVFLVYQMPREPSTPRIAVWRQLRRLGVAQLSDGLVAVPYDAATKERIEWIAHLVMEAGGSASIWIATPTVRKFGRSLADSLTAERAAEYLKVSSLVEDVLGADLNERRRTLRRLRAELRKVERRDYFPPPERQQARRSVAELAATLQEEKVR
jgi:hypothetical protein